MSKFTAWYERSNGTYWVADFTEDYYIIRAWYNGRLVKLTERRELIIYTGFIKNTDLNWFKRENRLKY